MMLNEKKLEMAMDDLGFAETGNGAELLREGTRLYCSGVKHLTGELYPALARVHDTSPAAVERSMRYAIEKAWMRGSIDRQLKWFGYTIDPERGKPTVREFVARMARICRED